MINRRLSLPLHSVLTTNESSGIGGRNERKFLSKGVGARLVVWENKGLIIPFLGLYLVISTIILYFGLCND